MLISVCWAATLLHQIQALRAQQGSCHTPLSLLARVQVLHSSVPTSQLQFALNGSVVGLCTSQQHASEEPDPPAPCLGLGIVRAVDASRRLLYVLTTLGEEALGRVTMLQVMLLANKFRRARGGFSLVCFQDALLPCGQHRGAFVQVHAVTSHSVCPRLRVEKLCADARARHEHSS